MHAWWCGTNVHDWQANVFVKSSSLPHPSCCICTIRGTAGRGGRSGGKILYGTLHCTTERICRKPGWKPSKLSAGQQRTHCFRIAGLGTNTSARGTKPSFSCGLCVDDRIESSNITRSSHGVKQPKPLGNRHNKPPHARTRSQRKKVRVRLAIRRLRRRSLLLERFPQSAIDEPSIGSWRGLDYPR